MSKEERDDKLSDSDKLDRLLSFYEQDQDYRDKIDKILYGDPDMKQPSLIDRIISLEEEQKEDRVFRTETKQTLDKVVKNTDKLIETVAPMAVFYEDIKGLPSRTKNIILKGSALIVAIGIISAAFIKYWESIKKIFVN